jgi:hypothetical protein
MVIVTAVIVYVLYRLGQYFRNEVQPQVPGNEMLEVNQEIEENQENQEIEEIQENPLPVKENLPLPDCD